MTIEAMQVLVDDFIDLLERTGLRGEGQTLPLMEPGPVGTLVRKVCREWFEDHRQEIHEATADPQKEKREHKAGGVSFGMLSYGKRQP